MLSIGPNLKLIDHGKYGDECYEELLRFYRGVDTLVQPNVISNSTSSPPDTPNEGATYLVPAESARGVWAGHNNHIARYTARLGYPLWEFFIPIRNWLVGVNDLGTNGTIVRFDGEAWVPLVAESDGSLSAQTTQSDPTSVSLEAIAYDGVSLVLGRYTINAYSDGDSGANSMLQTDTANSVRGAIAKLDTSVSAIGAMSNLTLAITDPISDEQYIHSKELLVDGDARSATKTIHTAYNGVSAELSLETHGNETGVYAKFRMAGNHIEWELPTALGTDSPSFATASGPVVGLEITNWIKVRLNDVDGYIPFLSVPV